MTTTTTEPNPSPGAAQPSLAGIHHVGLTVRDAEASAAWYETILGLGRAFQEPHNGSDLGGYTIVLAADDMSFSVGLDHHPAHAGDDFDCTRTGLDHVSFHVSSVDQLHDWAAHLDAHGVEHSGVYAMEGFPISLLTFRDPDGIQLELLAMHG